MGPWTYSQRSSILLPFFPITAGRWVVQYQIRKLIHLIQVRQETSRIHIIAFPLKKASITGIKIRVSFSLLQSLEIYFKKCILQLFQDLLIHLHLLDPTVIVNIFNDNYGIYGELKTRGVIFTKPHELSFIPPSTFSIPR